MGSMLHERMRGFLKNLSLALSYKEREFP